MVGKWLTLRWALATVTAVLTACSGQPSAELVPPSITVDIGGRLFALELAVDQATRRRGLSGRERIGLADGMLFVFPHAGKQSFWMRGCLVPIDLLYLDPGGYIVDLHRMHPVPGVPDDEFKTYPSKWDAQYAIELAGGMIDELELETGQQIDLPPRDLKRWAH